MDRSLVEILAHVLSTKILLFGGNIIFNSGKRDRGQEIYKRHVYSIANSKKVGLYYHRQIYTYTYVGIK